MPTSLRRAGIVAVLSLFAVAGCLLPDLGAFSGGGSTDASVNDGTTVDAPDTGAADAKSDAPAKRFCETYDGGTDATVCEDMDSPTALAFGWVKSDGGSLTTASAVSPPASLDVRFASDAGCTNNKVRWVAATPTGSGVHLELDVNMISTRADGSPTYWISVTWEGSNARCAAILASQTAPVSVNSSGDYLRLQYLTSSVLEVAAGRGPIWANGQPPSTSAFRHLVFDYDVDGKSPPVFTLDGQASAVVFEDAGAGITCSGMKLSEVQLGLNCGNNPDFHFRYDNVVITPK